MRSMAEKEGEEPRAALVTLTRKVEQIEAQVAAFASLREAYDTRFTMLSEKIGELRSMILGQAKDAADTKAKAERALMSLEGIKPEEFRAAIIRRDAEVETTKAKVATVEDMIKTLMKEISEFRNALAQFKGMEAILGMADESRKNIIRIQQLRDQVEVMSDKVMAAFMEFQRRFKDVTDLSIKVGTLEEQLRTLSKNVSQMDVTVKQAVTKTELTKLSGDIETLKQMGTEIKTYHEQISAGKNTADELRAGLEKAVKQLDARTRKEMAELNTRLKMLEKIVSRILKAILAAK
ncbi:MAG: hypothetical protein ACK4GQ_02315 [Candidatus Hadarchaeales archaeon]